MIKSIRVAKLPDQFVPPALLRLLGSLVEFEQANLIVGENGTGKSSFLGLILYAIPLENRFQADPRRVNLDRAKIRRYRWDPVKDSISISWDSSWIVVYHYGPDLYRSEITQRKLASDGEGSLYELLLYTSDLNKLDPTKGRSARGDEIVRFNSEVTRLFASGVDLGLELKKPAILISDEPETSLSRKRVRAIVNYFERWLDEGNQLITTSNHPWIIDALTERGAKVFDMDS